MGTKTKYVSSPRITDIWARVTWELTPIAVCLRRLPIFGSACNGNEIARLRYIIFFLKRDFAERN